MSENIDVKLKGYVLVDDTDRLLRRKQVWATREITRGWIWTEAEILIIRTIADNEGWEHPPVYKQAAYLNRVDGLTYINGEKELLP